MKLRLDLGDGSFIESDVPSNSLRRAMKRADDALRQGREPSVEDAKKIIRWQDEQHRKYGGIQRFESTTGEEAERTRTVTLSPEAAAVFNRFREEIRRNPAS